MVLLGAMVNGFILGSLIGHFWKWISKCTKETVMHAIDVLIIIIGIQMSLKSTRFLVVLISLFWMVENEEKLNELGIWLEVKLKAQQENQITKVL